MLAAWSLAACGAFARGVPTVTLSNGVAMPQLAISLPATEAAAAANIRAAYSEGIVHYVTANDYLNQRAVGAGLRALGAPRDSYFVTTMTSPCQCKQAAPHCERNITDAEECEATTRREVEGDLAQLNLSQVDLVLLHGPNLAAAHVGGCDAAACAAGRAQWRAYTALLREGKVRAIGAGNACPSCVECMLAEPGALVPMVTQLQYHVAYGADMRGRLAYYRSKGIVPHAYEPLALGKLASNALCAKIGAARNKTAAQVAMRWLVQNKASAGRLAVFTSSTSEAHLRQDAGTFGWQLEADEVDALDRVSCRSDPDLCTAYGGRMTWGCTE